MKKRNQEEGDEKKKAPRRETFIFDVVVLMVTIVDSPGIRELLQYIMEFCK